MLSGGYSSACTNVIAGSAQVEHAVFGFHGSSDEITKRLAVCSVRQLRQQVHRALWEMIEQVVKPKTWQ